MGGMGFHFLDIDLVSVNISLNLVIDVLFSSFKIKMNAKSETALKTWSLEDVCEVESTHRSSPEPLEWEHCLQDPRLPEN